MSQERLVGRVTDLLGLVLSPDWCIFILLYHTSNQLPELIEIETSIPVKVSGVKPDLGSHLYQAVLATCCFIQYGGATKVDTVLCLKSVLYHC
jgi:hypothetical protein